MYKSLVFLSFFVLTLGTYAGEGSDPLLKKAQEWLVFEDKKSSKAPQALTSAPAKPLSLKKKTSQKWRETFKDLKRLLVQSDPLGQDKTQGLRPIHLRLVKLNSYKTRLSNTISYVWRKKKQDTRSLSVTYSPLVLKDPFAQMKMDSWDISFGMRKYYKHHVFFQGNAGYRVYRPNEFYVKYFQNQGQAFGDRSLPYLTLGFGMRILKRVPILKTPLVLRASHTFGNDMRFPISGPHGFDRIGVRGFKIGMSVRLRI